MLDVLKSLLVNIVTYLGGYIHGYTRKGLKDRLKASEGELKARRDRDDIEDDNNQLSRDDIVKRLRDNRWVRVDKAD